MFCEVMMHRAYTCRIKIKMIECILLLERSWIMNTCEMSCAMSLSKEMVRSCSPALWPISMIRWECRNYYLRSTAPTRFLAKRRYILLQLKRDTCVNNIRVHQNVGQETAQLSSMDDLIDKRLNLTVFVKSIRKWPKSQLEAIFSVILRREELTYQLVTSRQSQKLASQ